MTRPSSTPAGAACFSRIESPLGTLIAVGAEEPRGLALSGLYFEAAPHAARAIPAGALEAPERFVELRRQLADYFAGRRAGFELALSAEGTEFQRQVWSALARIPYGSTATYAELARGIGKPSAVRAVGAANASNPLSIVVPCHRVIGAGGALTGYAGGLHVKRSLLELERRHGMRQARALA